MTEQQYTEKEHDQQVYTATGLALRWAQMFEMEVVNILFLYSLAKETFSTRKQAEEFLYKKGIQPLRHKLDEIFKRVKFEPDLRPTFYEALEKRNYFVHQYFWNRMELFMNVNGRDQMITELKDITDLFYSAYTFAIIITDLYAKQVGLTNEIVQNDLLHMKQ